ncbi:uncharacterized protein LOC131663644 [Phymastichus coffea]|uniref:uncharacterized protein LOC131663644 n=1 Tax=Phymastichus coffea TaxID=108790 RepID=UPI00273C08FD|nr:uncharacterized protein LOC131663644 [Phymastichus coffea]
MENSCDHHDEDKFLASKTWNKIIDSASKIGYREGIEDGSSTVFQDGFDRGYRDGFKTAFLLGTYKGISDQLTKKLKHPEEIENILSDTKKSVCYLCETQSSADKSSESIVEVENCQSEHYNKISKILQDYFDPILKVNSINPSMLNVHT